MKPLSLKTLPAYTSALFYALLFFFVLSVLTKAQTASYPNSVVTNQELKVVKNNCQAKLSASLTSSDTSIVVSANTCITPNTLATIDSEIISICGVSGNVLTVGNSSCPNVDGRGFDGTAAAAHTPGKNVSLFVDAWHFAAPAAEIKAIETALGPNLSNVQTSPSLNSSAYNFSPQTPGGSLIIGNNSVTFTPVPAGVNGSDPDHYLYVSNGTGTAEPCLINGGAGTAGQTSGTIILQCSNTHSGAWTVRSATGGVAEAVQAIATGGVGGKVELPSGTLDFWAPVTIHGRGTTITGQNIHATIVNNHHASLPSFHFLNGNSNEISYMQIQPNATAQGLIGIQVELQNGLKIHHMSIIGQTCIQTLPTNFGLFVSDSNLDSFETGTTALFDNLSADDVYLTNLIFGCSGSLPRPDGIRITEASGFYITQIDVLTCQIGLHVNAMGGTSAAFIFGEQAVFDTSVDGGILIEARNTAVAESIQFVNSWTASTQAGNGVTARTFDSGVVDGVQFIGHRSYDNWDNGYSFSGPNVKHVAMTSSRACGNSKAAIDGAYGLEFANGVSNFQVNGGAYGGCDNRVDQQAVPIAVTNAGSDNYQIMGADTTSTHASGISALGGANRIIINNLGVDNVIGTVASASSMAFPLNPEFTVTGTSGVGTITACAAGRTGSFRTVDGAVTFTAGASIGNTVTTTQNVPTYYSCDGTHVWLR